MSLKDSVSTNREVPLRCVVRKDFTSDVAVRKREEEILHHTSLNEPMFD